MNDKNQKKRDRKLSVNRETLRKLNLGELGQVAGGAWITSGDPACGGRAFCSSISYQAPTNCNHHDWEE